MISLKCTYYDDISVNGFVGSLYDSAATNKQWKEETHEGKERLRSIDCEEVQVEMNKDAWSND